jgi:hypothetical protein
MQSSADVLRADQATTERVKVLVPFGLTERQARFLATVMLHSGVFVGRLTDTLREARHLPGPRVLCDGTGKPLTQKIVQVLVRRTARRANVKPGIHILGTRSVRTSRCVSRRRGPSRSSLDTRTSAQRSATCT